MWKLSVKIQVLYDDEVVVERSMNFPPDLLEHKRERAYSFSYWIASFVDTWCFKVLSKLDALIEAKTNAKG